LFPAAFTQSAPQFQASTNDCAVTGVPSWNVYPSRSVIVQLTLSSDSIDSATAKMTLLS
jgi:hypothetical protein